MKRLSLFVGELQDMDVTKKLTMSEICNKQGVSISW